MTAPTHTDAAAALIAANRRRRRIRRWIAIGTLPLSIAALLLTGKLLSMYAFAHQSVTSHVAGDAEGTIRAAQGQEVANAFERYKAPYNTGVGLAAAQRLPEARAKFEQALPLADGLEVCPVRVNLGLVLEQMGDAAREAGDGAAAAEFYAEALAVTLETPDECGSPEADEQSPDPERSLADALDDLEERLQQKQQDQGDGQEQRERPEEQEQPQPSEDELDDLEERLRQGQSDREEQERGQGDDGSGSGTDRPW